VSRESVRRFSLARQGGCPKRGRGECRQSKFTDDFHLFVLWSKRGLRSQVNVGNGQNPQEKLASLFWMPRRQALCSCHDVECPGVGYFEP